MRATLQERIDDAREKGGVAPTSASAAGAPAAAPPTSAPSSSDAGAPASTAPIRLTAEVSLDPKFVATAPRDASVFVYAKAASGPPMPLAVQRLTVADLPAKVVLTEDMGMLPNLKLSMFPQVIVGARVSRTGNAIAQSGDLQTQSAPIDVRSTDPIKLTIDTVKP
jgi:cytochrome c-type biogenesis protein CcmH